MPVKLRTRAFSISNSRIPRTVNSRRPHATPAGVLTASMTSLIDQPARPTGRPATRRKKRRAPRPLPTVPQRHRHVLRPRATTAPRMSNTPPVPMTARRVASPPGTRASVSLSSRLSTPTHTRLLCGDFFRPPSASAHRLRLFHDRLRRFLPCRPRTTAKPSLSRGAFVASFGATGSS